MTDPAITKDDLFRAILALDVYHRDYNRGLSVTGNQIGNAAVGRSSANENLIGFGGTSYTHETIGFYAQEYTWNDTTVIAYRGTDDGFAGGASP